MINKFRDLGHKFFISMLNKIFIYFINLIILSYYFIIYIFKILNFHVKIIINDYSFSFLLISLTNPNYN